MPSPENATSSIVALFVVGVAVLVAGLLMLRASFRARRAYRQARRTHRPVTGRVVSNRIRHTRKGGPVYYPVVEFDDPRTGRRRTFSPPMAANRLLKPGREVAVLCDDRGHGRGREPLLDEWPFRGGFAGGCLFFLFAVMCTALGALAIYAVI